MKDLELLHNFVKLLKLNGFKVFTSDSNKNYSYCHFTKNDNIGYVQAGYYGGLEFSTVHKPNRFCGTGFCLYSGELGEQVHIPTIEHANKTFIKYPSWAKNVDKNNVIKYKSWDEYKQNPINNICKIIEL